MSKLRFFLVAVLLVLLLGCIGGRPGVTRVDFELITVMKEGSTYRAVVFVRSVEPRESIPASAFSVATRNGIFFLDSENVSFLGLEGAPYIEEGRIFVITLRKGDGYFWIYPTHYDVAIEGHLLVVVGNLTEEEAGEMSHSLKPPIFPKHSVAYKDGRLFLLEDTGFGKAGEVISGFKEEEATGMGNLTLREGYSLKRITIEGEGGSVQEITVAVYKGSRGFWVEPGNEEQRSFLFPGAEGS
ncbi:hypothetical protein [Palaeococcus ferrophilus]|uniref:hypothetical protein n=1 Tax=Palaeococcus ferrophilus TaxID=83868 RepID=UPI00064FE12B|nr:hypothetical protein [Palaeococcus ferrophilus]